MTITGPIGGPGPIGPQVFHCPDCDATAVQFLVGRGAFCLGCGRLLMPINPKDPWKTIGYLTEKATTETPTIRPEELRRFAVEQSLSGLVGQIKVAVPSVTEERIREALTSAPP